MEAREKLKKDDVVLLRIEQLYPFPAKTLVKELKPYAKNSKFFWCQEEPKNMGAWFSVRDYIQWTLDTIKANNKEISYIGRSPDASPATGYAKRHISQQQEIINFQTSTNKGTPETSLKMKRNFVETVSITSVKKEEDICLIYNDLLKGKTSKKTIVF